jgi:hypothetical protein
VSEAAVTSDRSRWPLLHVRVDGPPTQENAAEIRAAMDEALAEPGPHAVIVELTRARIPTPFLVRDQARWFKERAEALAKSCRAIAIVTPSAAMRGVPNAILRIFAPPSPVRAFKTLESAEAWCMERLEERMSGS